MTTQQHHHHEDQTSRIFYELSTLLLNMLRSPVPFSDDRAVPARRRRSSSAIGGAHVSATGFAWLMLGVCLSMMLCGSVTFFVGFLLMPWVLFLVMVVYFVGVVSTLSVLGRSLFGSVLSSCKDVPAWKLM